MAIPDTAQPSNAPDDGTNQGGLAVCCASLLQKLRLLLKENVAGAARLRIHSRSQYSQTPFLAGERTASWGEKLELFNKGVAATVIGQALGMKGEGERRGSGRGEGGCEAAWDGTLEHGVGDVITQNCTCNGCVHCWRSESFAFSHETGA